MSEPAAALGLRLKAERERRGLSSAKAADSLHLDAWIIDALEADDYQRIGPAVYAKGHLKRYAAMLELPAPEILAAYDSHVFAPKPPAPQAATVRLSTRTPAVDNLPWPRILSASAAALLLLGILWWKPWHQRDRPVSDPPVAERANSDTADNGVGQAELSSPMASADPTSGAGAANSAALGVIAGTVAPATAPATTTVTPSATAANSTTVTPSATAVATTTAPAATAASDSAGIGRARLLFRFSADSWVDVRDAAGLRAFAGKGRANSVRVIRGAAPMRVYLGFASGVQLEINDRAVAIGRQFVSGDVARFEAGADGVLRRDPHGRTAASGAPSRNAHPRG